MKVTDIPTRCDLDVQYLDTPFAVHGMQSHEFDHEYT